MTDIVELALLRGSAEHLYEYCSKVIDHSIYGCALCPLHVACSQARRLDFTNLRDLMGSILYCIQIQQKSQVKEEA